MSLYGLKSVLAALLTFPPEACSSRASRVERKASPYKRYKSLDKSFTIPSVLRAAATDVQIKSG